MDTTSLPFIAQHPLQDNYRLLRVYAWYRLLLASMLLGMFYLDFKPNILGQDNPELYLYTSATYLLVSCFTLVRLLAIKAPPTTPHIFTVCLIDIVVLTLVTYVSGGVESGIGLLVFISVAASSIFLQGQLAMLLAAMACIAIITEYLVSSQLGDSTRHRPFVAGLTGLLIFLTSLIFQYLTRRIRSTQQAAAEQSAHAQLMQELNRTIVQRMHTGIAVLDKEHRILLHNAAAERLLQLPQASAVSADIFNYHPILRSRLHQWLVNPQRRTAPLQLEEGCPDIQLNFTQLPNDTSPLTLAFIDDNRLLAQQAQQLKLASLGQLTANIAHEVRNPLGAISHAAQLLDESTALSEPDRRLANIIHAHSRRVNGIIENVLQLSRRQRPIPERRDLGSWLTQFAQHYRQLTKDDCDVELLLPDEPLPVTVDFAQMDQVLNNLCDNACRYSRKKTGQARVTLRAYLHEQLDIPCLDVIDYGEGIGPAEREKLFEPFFTTEQQGTGLGLYIAREICIANQASLDYKHAAWGLSCFQISFPHLDKIL